MPRPSKTCAFGASTKDAYYSLSACYWKTFWQPWKLVLKVALKKSRNFHLEHFVMKNSTHPLLPEISARTTKTVQGLKLTFPFRYQLATRRKFLVANLNFLVTKLVASMVMSEENASALTDGGHFTRSSSYRELEENSPGVRKKQFLLDLLRLFTVQWTF